MDWDRLFDAAIKYKSTRLWKKLYDSQLFAVKYSDGEIGYCCVMGHMGELNAFAVYPGQAGLDSLRRLHQAEPAEDYIKQHERMREQDCLLLSFESKSALSTRALDRISNYCSKKGVQLRGKNAYPHFERFRTGFERWYLEDEADMRRMLEALDAAAEVAERLAAEKVKPAALGLTEDAPYDHAIPLLSRGQAGYVWSMHALPPEVIVPYPEMSLPDDVSAARLARMTRKGEWAVRVFRSLISMTDSEGEDSVLIEDLDEAPMFPYMLMIVETGSGMVLNVGIAKAPNAYGDELGRFVISTAVEHGLPKRILAKDERTKALLAPFCRDYGVKLQIRQAIPALDEALDDMIDAFDEDDVTDEEAEMIEGMLRDETMLRQMPDEMLIEMIRDVYGADLPGDIVENLIKEALRRGIGK